jgi:ubiquinone/menaquinone biosynthesis C-methylase UbiE
VDWEAEATARKAVAEKSLSTIAFLQADIAELPDNLGVFDMIIGRRVLMYQSDVSRAIGSLLPFLAKNGKMVFRRAIVWLLLLAPRCCRCIQRR